MVKERNIVVCILLSIITCGIYAIYWFITLTDDTSKLQELNLLSFLLLLVVSMVFIGTIK